MALQYQVRVSRDNASWTDDPRILTSLAVNWIPFIRDQHGSGSWYVQTGASDDGGTTYQWSDSVIIPIKAASLPLVPGNF